MILTFKFCFVVELVIHGYEDAIVQVSLTSCYLKWVDFLRVHSGKN